MTPWRDEPIFMVSDRHDHGGASPLHMMVCTPKLQDHHWSELPHWSFTPDGDPIYNEGTLHIGVTPESVAQEQFADVFGDWQAKGCRIFSKAEFLEKYLPFIPGALATVLASDKAWPQQIYWHQQIYISYS